MDRTRALIALAQLASEQAGMVTARQAGAAGVSRQQLARLADDQLIERVRHGVYRLAGAPPHPLDDLRAAWLALNPLASAADRLRDARSVPGVLEVVSHRSAAFVHDLGDVDALELEFTVPTRRQPRDPQVRLHRGAVGAPQWTLVDGLPVTTVLATIVDLAEAHLDGGHLAGIVNDAIGRRAVSVAEISNGLAPHAHRYGLPRADGAALTRQLLGEAAGGFRASSNDDDALDACACAESRSAAHDGSEIR